MRRALVVAMALAAVTAAASGRTAAAAPASAPDFSALDVITYPAPKAAPPFALPDLDGKTVRLEDFRGKFLLMFFWATW